MRIGTLQQLMIGILLVDGGGNVTFNVKNVGGISSAGHGALNVWKHIAVERASATSKLYVDGALTATVLVLVT